MTLKNRFFHPQITGLAGSVRTNYIEAHETLNKKDFLMRVNASQRETKERDFWLNILFLKKLKRLFNDLEV